MSLGALLSVANENILSKCSIGIDKFMDRVHAVEMAAGSPLRVGGDVVLKYI